MRLILVLLTACLAVPIDNTPRRLTLQICQSLCENSGVHSFIPGYYYQGNKLCSLESDKYHCTQTSNTIHLACECNRVWSK